MDDRIRLEHERNLRVSQYASDNAGDIVVPSPAATLLGEIGTHNTNASTGDAEYTQKYGSSRAATVSKNAAESVLRTWIERMSVAADAMRDLHNGIEKQFPTPRKLNKAALLARGRADYMASDPYEADFIAYGSFPADFRAQLNTACDDFESSTANQDTQTDDRIMARAAVEDEVTQSSRKVRLLHGIMKNLYFGNAAKTAGWHAAYHVESSPKKKTPPTP